MKKIQQEGPKPNEVNELKRRMNTVNRSLSDEIEDQPVDCSDLHVPNVVLKPGDTVKLLKLNQSGTVISEPDSDGILIVQAGIMKITTNIKEIVPVNAQKVQKQITQNVVTGIKRPVVRTEIDVRGHTLSEAILVIDKYVDDAIMAGLHEVSIIHGKGTGALRAGIREYLKKNERIEGYRDGKQGEGDFGVTVLKL